MFQERGGGFTPHEEKFFKEGESEVAKAELSKMWLEAMDDVVDQKGGDRRVELRIALVATQQEITDEVVSKAGAEADEKVLKDTLKTVLEKHAKEILAQPRAGAGEMRKAA